MAQEHVGARSALTAGLAGAVDAESNTTPQYYYRANGCPAQTAHDADCICWHDEGTGPFPDERPDDPDTLKEWRFKPANAGVTGADANVRLGAGGPGKEDK